jgi:hypothetical protein
MKSQHIRRRRRAVVAALAGVCLAVPASANAIPQGDTKYDLHPTAPTSAGVTTAEATIPAATVTESRGDTKYDAPGASRAPEYDAPAIHVFRPQTTIVRDVDEALPIVLSGAALLLAFGGVVLTMRGGGKGPRPRRSH